MSRLVLGFKACAFQAGSTWKFSNGRLVRDFGLDDFLSNYLAVTDDAPTIAVKAIHFFCGGAGPGQDVFKFAVLATVSFLHQFHSGGRGKVPPQSMSDLVDLLKGAPTEDQLRRWVVSHFG